MAAAATLVRARVKEVVEAEFPAHTVENDKLPRAAGRDGADRVACYPDRETESFSDVNVLEIEVVLQFYLAYEAQPDEHIARDPAEIEAIAARLREAFQTESGGSDPDFWYLRLVSVEYPDDPTGNRTRLEARFTARAQNSAALG